MSYELNEVQFDILDNLYFVESYENVLADVDHPEPIIRDELRTMIDKGWVHVMEFDEKSGDYLRTPIYDTDNMKEYHYLASKEGLLRHTSG